MDAAEQQGRAVDAVGEVGLQRVGQRPEAVGRQGGVFGGGIAVHHPAHEGPAVGGVGAAVRPGHPQGPPGIKPVHRPAMAQQRDLPAGGVPALEGGRVDGDEPGGLAGIFLQEALGHIPAHGLAHQAEGAHLLLFQNAVEPDRLVPEGEIQREGPGRPVPRRIPDQDAVPPGKGLDLQVEQPVVGGQSGQQHQGHGLRRGEIGPVVDVPLGGGIDLSLHGTAPPVRCWDLPGPL